MCEIITKLQTILKDDNLQDQKMLLLAQLVDDRFTIVENQHNEVVDTLKKLNDNILTIKNDLETVIGYTTDCPVFKKKDHYETLTFLITRPKILIATLVGTLILVFFGLQTTIINTISLIKILIP
jgi:hypothetical protein